jgi:dipeptidyl aminopeptidase/acylaminoacyl peptidase
VNRFFAVLILILPALPMSVLGADEAEPAGPVVEIGQMLALELPLGVDPLNDSAKADEIRRALVMQLDQPGLPRSGQTVRLFGQDKAWQVVSPQSGHGDGLMLWAVNLEVDRFVRGKLKAANLAGLHVFHNGQSVSHDNGTVELKLVAGSHSLWLVHEGRTEEGSPSLNWEGQDEQDRVTAHVEPRRRVSARMLTNAETVTNMALSADGRHLAMSFSARSDAADLDLRRMEIHDLRDQRIVRHWTGSPPGALAWSPDNRWLATQEGDNLWLHEFESGQARLLLANHEHIGSWRWHPDSGSIIFAWTEPWEAENDKRRRVRSLEDRWKTFRDNSQLYQVDAASGLIRPLTTRDRSVNLQDIDPAGNRLLLSERLIDYTEAPHNLFRLFELALDTLEEREVGQFRVLNGALFAEEGYWLLSGPGLPQGDGVTTADDLTPNEYDTQLYALSHDGETARSVSRDFDPAFGQAHRLPNGDLLLTALAGEGWDLVRFDASRERFSKVDTGLEVLEGFVASEGRRPVVAARGTDADAPQRVHLVDLQRNRSQVLFDSKTRSYADIVLGPVEARSFTNANGDAIDGRYYLPPDFDPDKKYPLIVYYYGGTTPVNRQFTGRYPFHLWAAKGYVIYVLQPRGTIGYGQEFSALHVNAWGRYTAEDIIEGTGKFVEAHEFIDGDRIGNIGASYGGFMTMHLATLTDLYAASISHAGISALTSYWGQGWWGYGYSGIASRDSFPWNNPELYVGQSPVYQADRITTPLLLLTGDSDTNVPPGESHNMFTALKLLGREVELIEFPDEDHWILDREKRYVWWDSMLAWFDYWLKDEPEWWHHLYPETAPES